jgi:uracil-DNA glycosylase
LGAYPSALHVCWTPPKGKPVKALAVDNEPTPFWSGDDEVDRIADWKERVRYDEERWGTITSAGKLNGSTGRALVTSILEPLGITQADTWMTDCLDTYRCSDEQAIRMFGRYNAFAHDCGLPLAILPEHPDEDDIASEAKQHHNKRLREEVRAASPDWVITLGNAALRVLTGLIDEVPAPLPHRLVPNNTYGQVLEVRLLGRNIRWLPLAHPAAPRDYQTAHDQWRTRTARISDDLASGSPGRINGILHEELMAIAREYGLEPESPKMQWTKVPGRSGLKIYLQHSDRRGCCRRVHLSGFTFEHPAIRQISEREAKEKHLGNVRGEILLDALTRDDGIDAFRRAIRHIAL